MTTDDLPAGSDPAARVGALLLDSLMALPLRSLLVPELHAPLVRAALRGSLRGPLFGSGPDAVPATLTAHAVRWLSSQETLRRALPPALIEMLRELLRRPYVPEPGLLLGLLLAPPLRSLTRELMVGTLLDYGRKLRAATAEPAPGAKAAGASKGGLLGRLATEAVRKGGAAAQALAPGVTSLVTDELERQMQRRATEFADGSVDELLQRAAALLTDPRRQSEHTALKLAMLDYVLTLRGPELARELARLQPHAVGEVVRAALLDWLERDTSTAELEELLRRLRDTVKDEAPAPTLATVLASAGVLEPLRAALGPLAAQVLAPLLDSGSLRKALAAPTG